MNWNGRHFLEKYLPLVEVYSQLPNVEVIVADNGSTDATADSLQALGEALFGSRFTRIRFEENRNFGPACNAGASVASAPLLFFLNNDTLLTPGWAPPLLDALAGDSSLGAVGPLLLYEDGTVQHVGVFFAPLSIGHLYQGFPGDHPVTARPRQCQALTAAALMLSKEDFIGLGGFYEEYRNCFEDVDLCLRLGKLRKKLLCVTSSRIIHLESQTPGRKSKQNESHNAQLLFQRCTGLFQIDKHTHGLRDGFVPFVNDVFGVGLRMSDEAETGLMREAAGQTPDVLYRLTRAHPYWVQGREWLASILEKQGHFQDAYVLLAEVANILTTTHAEKKVLQLAIRAGDPALLQEAQSVYRSIAVIEKDVEYCRRTLRMLRENQGDAMLEEMYEVRLRELAP